MGAGHLEILDIFSKHLWDFFSGNYQMSSLIWVIGHLAEVCYTCNISCRSRISRWGVLTHWGGTNLRCICFSVKMYVKTKELDPVGGPRAGGTPLDPPLNMPPKHKPEYTCWKLSLVAARVEVELCRIQMLQRGCTCPGNNFQAILDCLCKFLAYIQYKENLEKKERRQARQPPPKLDPDYPLTTRPFLRAKIIKIYA